MRCIPYFWIRDVDSQTYMRVRKVALARNQSVADTARELLYRHLGTDVPDQKKTARYAPARKVRIKARKNGS